MTEGQLAGQYCLIGDKINDAELRAAPLYGDIFNMRKTQSKNIDH
jgi:hypothetical protein